MGVFSRKNFCMLITGRSAWVTDPALPYYPGGYMTVTDTFSSIRLLLRSVFFVIGMLVFAGVQLLSQPVPDTKGQDFFLTFPPNYHNNIDSPWLDFDSLYIFVAAVSAPTQCSITYRDRNGTSRVHSFTIVNAAQVYKFGVPWSRYELAGINSSGFFDPNHQSGQIAPQSFRVTSNRDVTVYALSRATTTSDAMLVLPTDVLGTQYRVLSYNSDGRDEGPPQSIDIDWGVSTPSQIAIVATRNNTIVNIRPSAPVVGPTANPFQVSLNEGDAYLLQASITTANLRGDLSGTLVESSQPIAVFSSHQRSLLPVTSTRLTSRDYLLEQMPPISTWGKSYILTPFPLPTSVPAIQGAHDIVRVLAAYDNTSVVIDKVERARLNAGQFYEAPLQNAALLTSSKEVLVAQYKRSAQTGSNNNTISDPFMIVVPPRKQFLSSYLCINAQAFDTDMIYMEQYCTIICLTDYKHTVKIDGTAVEETRFREVPNTCYSYAWVPVEDGSHNVESEKPIGLYIYGYGVADSYGYVGGMAFTTFEEPALMVSRDTALCIGDSVQLHASGGSTFQWSPATGLSCTDCPDPIAKPDDPTYYDVTITDSLGCAYKFSVFVDVQPVPVAVAEGDTIICSGQAASLRASGGRLFQWSPAQGLSCTDCPNPIATPTRTTTYTVKVSNTDISAEGACTDTDSVTITVIASAFVDLPQDTLVCAKDSLVFDLPDENTYHWFPPTGLSCTECANPVIKPTKTTKYTIIMVNKGGCKMTKTMTVTVVDLPIVSITPNIVLCDQEPPVRLLARGGNFYQWSPPDGLSCTDCASPLARPDKTTTYTVKVAINASCETVTTITITVQPSPTVALSNDTTICPNTSVQLSASGGSHYNWTPKEYLSCADCPNPIASPVESTTFYVTITNSEGCSLTDSIQVTVRRPADISVLTTATICAGVTAQLQATGGASYLWEPAEGLSCTNCANPVASPQKTTHYTVTIDSGNDCPEQREVTVTVLPVPELTVSADTTICRSGEALLQATGNGTYSWTPVAGLSCDNCSSPVATPTSTTRYYVTLDNGECTTTDSVLVTVKPCGLNATFPAVNFGTIAVCDSASQPCTLTNTGLEPIEILDWRIVGTDAAAFEAELQGVITPLTLGIGQSLNFLVTCHPLAEGQLTASIVITTHDPDFTISNTWSVEAYKRTAVFTLGPDLRTAPGSKIQLDINAQSEQWAEINADSLELTIFYKSTWMRYADEIQRGPALDASWQIHAREDNRLNGEHSITIAAGGIIPITRNGTIATLTIEPLLTNEFIYTPRIEARIVEKENCVRTEGGTATLDIAFCVAQLRPIRYNNVSYDFAILNGSAVRGNEVQVQYNVALAADTRIEFYNQLGVLVADYRREAMQPGEYSEAISLPQLASGMYIARFSSGPFSKSIPLLLGAE